MNTAKLEKLKKSLDNKFIPEDVKVKIRKEIEKLEKEIKAEELTKTEIKEETAEIEDKVEKAVEKAEEKEEESKPRKSRKPKASSDEPKATETAIKKTAMSVAKSIRKKDEKWSDAMKRATAIMNKEKVEVKRTTKSELDRLLARVRRNKSLMSDLSGVKDLGRDAVRKAKPVGKRVSKTGNVYYEYRANKTDRKTYGAYSFADGGEFMTDPNFGNFQNNIYAGGGKVEFVENFTIKDGIQISEGKSDDGKIFYTASIISYPLHKIIPMNENKSYVVDRAKKIYKSMLDYKKSEEFKTYGKELFAFGGQVVTDLAGHNGGHFGLGNYGLLDGFSGTHYDGLVGETGAMSSGELFMNGGGVGILNQQVIDDASQSYVNYYLGEGATAGIFKDGGAIENQYAGKSAKEVWNLLNQKQKEHFLLDHFNHFDVDDFKGKNLIEIAKMDYKEIPVLVRKEFENHIEMGQYAKGGGIRKVGNREYSTGRNWTNDHRHINQSEEHEVNYTRKGKFLGVFNDGGKVNSSRKQLKKGDDILIIGRRWFDRVNGNTYHTAEVQVNGEFVGKSRMTYGYGDYYIETGKEILLDHYKLPRGMKETSPLWQLREYGVILNKYAIDGLKRELATGGSLKNTPEEIQDRLEYLRDEIRNESISYDEIVELQSMKEYIAPDDVELLQWAGVEEFSEEEFSKGGAVSPFKNIMETNTITEKEINLIKLRMNNDKVDNFTQEAIDFIWDNSPQLTPDQNKKGIDYLRNLWKSPSGKERVNNPFGYREQEALETFEYFELRGFYDAGNRYRKFYVPLYTCVGAETSFEYYISGGNINIVG